MQMPSTGEWIYILVYSYSGIHFLVMKKYIYMSELFTYSTSWMNLKVMRLSKHSQAKKGERIVYDSIYT